MNHDPIHEKHLIEEIAMEVFLKTQSLKTAKEAAHDKRDIEDMITALAGAYEDFILGLPSAMDRAGIATCRERIEYYLKAAETLLDTLPARPEAEFWDTIGYGQDKTTFNLDRFCAEMDEELDFLPF